MIKRPRSLEMYSVFPGHRERLSISGGHMSSSGSSAAGRCHSLQPAHTAYPSLEAGVFCSPALTGELSVEMVSGQFIKNKLNQA